MPGGKGARGRDRKAKCEKFQKLKVGSIGGEVMSRLLHVILAHGQRCRGLEFYTFAEASGAAPKAHPWPRALPKAKAFSDAPGATPKAFAKPWHPSPRALPKAKAFAEVSGAMRAALPKVKAGSCACTLLGTTA